MIKVSIEVDSDLYEVELTSAQALGFYFIQQIYCPDVILKVDGKVPTWELTCATMEAYEYDNTPNYIVVKRQHDLLKYTFEDSDFISGVKAAIKIFDFTFDSIVYLIHL